MSFFDLPNGGNFYSDQFYSLSPTIPLMPNYRSALAATKAGTADTIIAIDDDSTGFGDGGLLQATVAERTGWVQKLVSHFNRAGYNCVNAQVKPRIATAAFTEDRWTIAGSPFNTSPTSNWSYFGGGWVGAYTNNTDATALVVTPGFAWDIADIYYVRGGGGGGTLRATATGGSNVDQSTSGGLTIAKFSATAASVSATNTLTLSRQAGAVFITGVIFRRSDIKQVLLVNGSYPGATITAFDNPSSGFNQLAQQDAIDAHLTVLGCGINEAQSAVSTATFEADVAAVRTAIAALGSDILIKSCVPSSDSTVRSREAGYWTAIQAYAATNNIAYADLFNSAPFSGNYVSALMDDTLHPNNAGHEQVAAFMASALIP